MRLYPDTMTLREARDDFFAANADVFGPDGGYGKKWVRIELGPIPLYIPNTQARRRAVVLHDLHHIAAGYSTHIIGECEIGAWEVGAGCGPYWVAWVLNMWAMALGPYIAPRKTFRAFVRGRHTDTLYHAPFDVSMLGETLGSMRSRLGLNNPQPQARAADAVQFMLWLAASSLVALIPAAPFIAVAAGVIYLLLRLCGA
jgi:hypothetical protein